MQGGKQSARSGWGLEFGKNLATSGKILSTLLPAGPGAADLIASRIPPGLGLASGVCRIASLLRRIGWHGVIGFSMDGDGYS